MMIFGFLPQNLKTQAVAVAFSIAWLEGEVEPQLEGARAWVRVAGFRRELYRCFTVRADALFDLCDAVLCAEGPVRTLVGLSLVPGHRRGHGGLYDALNAGRVDVTRLRWSLAALPLPDWPDGRIRLAVDMSNWLRPDAETSPGRMFCHVYGRQFLAAAAHQAGTARCRPAVTIPKGFIHYSCNINAGTLNSLNGSLHSLPSTVH